jgi:hypothetical protein
VKRGPGILPFRMQPVLSFIDGHFPPTVPRLSESEASWVNFLHKINLEHFARVGGRRRVGHLPDLDEVCAVPFTGSVKPFPACTCRDTCYLQFRVLSRDL